MTMGDNDQLLNFAGGDRLATLLREALQQLCDGIAGPELGDLANDVLSGHLDVRQMASDIYAGEVSFYLQAFQQGEDDQPSDELRETILRIEAKARAITDAHP